MADSHFLSVHIFVSCSLMNDDFTEYVIKKYGAKWILAPALIVGKKGRVGGYWRSPLLLVRLIIL